MHPSVPIFRASFRIFSPKYWYARQVQPCCHPSNERRYGSCSKIKLNILHFPPVSLILGNCYLPVTLYTNVFRFARRFRAINFLKAQRSIRNYLSVHQHLCEDTKLSVTLFLVGLLESAPTPVTARSKAWVCSRLLPGIASSNPAGNRDVCLLWVLWFVRQSSHSEKSYRLWFVWVWSWSLDNEETLAHWGLLHNMGGGELEIFLWALRQLGKRDLRDVA
jgi:hypothetical protein